MRRAASWLAVVALGLPAAAVAENWIYRAEAYAGYDSNAGNSGTSMDRRGATVLYGSTSATREERFGSRTALQLTEGIELERWLGIDRLTNARYSVRWRWLHRSGQDFHSPLMAATLGVGARHSASDIRSGFDYRLGFTAAIPVTTVLVARAGTSLWRREASHGRAFDLDGASYTLDVDWRIGLAEVVYAGLQFDRGNFVVTGRGYGIVGPKDQHLYLEPSASVVEADEAFGQDWWAFRVEGNTFVATAGVNVALSPALSLDAQVRRGEAQMDRFTYERWVGSVGVLFRW